MKCSQTLSYYSVMQLTPIVAMEHLRSQMIHFLASYSPRLKACAEDHLSPNPIPHQLPPCSQGARAVCNDRRGEAIRQSRRRKIFYTYPTIGCVSISGYPQPTPAILLVKKVQKEVGSVLDQENMATGRVYPHTLEMPPVSPTPFLVLTCPWTTQSITSPAPMQCPRDTTASGGLLFYLCQQS